jgi:hypothetical protein
VHRRQLIEELGLHELQAGLEQFRAQRQCVDPTNHEHEEREPQVHRADVLVVGRKKPAPPTMRMMAVLMGIVSMSFMLSDYCAHHVLR